MATTRPFPQTLAAAAVGQNCCNLVAQLLRSMKRRTDQILGHVGLVGEIDPGLDQRQRLDQPPPPRFGAVADQTLELPKRLPPLRRRLRGDQIAKTLHRSEIEPAALERPPGELARLGKAAAGNRSQCIKHAGDHRVTAVQLQLSHVFAGLALRARKPQRQRLIDRLTARRIAHAHQRRLSRLRHAADQLLQRDAGLRTRHAHHSNRRRRPAGGQSEDGGTIGHVGG